MPFCLVGLRKYVGARGSERADTAGQKQGELFDLRRSGKGALHAFREARLRSQPERLDAAERIPGGDGPFFLNAFLPLLQRGAGADPIGIRNGRAPTRLL